jgi:F-type H+-transporting ATPase subunit b
MLQIDATAFIVFFIVWILVFVLSRVFWKPMIKVIRDRNAQIDGDGEASRKTGIAYEQGLQEIDQTLKSARLAAEKTRETLEVEALKEKSRMLTEASTMAKGEIEKAGAALQEEIFRLKQELETETGRLADQIEKRLLN